LVTQCNENDAVIHR